MKPFPLFLGARETIIAGRLVGGFDPVWAKTTGCTLQSIVKRRKLSIPAAQQAISIETLSAQYADVTTPAFDVHVGVEPDQIKQAVEPTISRHYGRRRTDQITADKAVSRAANPIITEPSSTSISRLHRIACSTFVLV